MSRGCSDQEAPPTAVPLAEQQKSSATAVRLHQVATSATSRSTVPCASTLVSGVTAESAVPDAPKCTIAVVTGSNADGQTDGTESSEGDGERIGQVHGDSPDKTNGANARTDMERPVSRAAVIAAPGETARVGVSASESVAWEMLGAALRTLEVVGQMGAEVVTKARDPARKVGVPV